MTLYLLSISEHSRPNVCDVIFMFDILCDVRVVLQHGKIIALADHATIKPGAFITFLFFLFSCVLLLLAGIRVDQEELFSDHEIAQKQGECIF